MTATTETSKLFANCFYSEEPHENGGRDADSGSLVVSGLRVHTSEPFKSVFKKRSRLTLSPKRLYAYRIPLRITGEEVRAAMKAAYLGPMSFAHVKQLLEADGNPPEGKESFLSRDAGVWNRFVSIAPDGEEYAPSIARTPGGAAWWFGLPNGHNRRGFGNVWDAGTVLFTQGI